jgi:hypothetical protein
MSTVNRCVRSVSLIVFVLSAASGTTSAAVTYKAGVPDYYQHQKSLQTTWDWKKDPYPGPPDAIPSPLKPSYTGKNWWESTGGWCSTTAWVNALSYADTKLGATGLFDHSKGHLSGLPEHSAPRTWQEKFAYANEDLAIRAGSGTDGACAWPQHIRSYADSWGVGLKVEEFDFSGGKVRTKDTTGGAYTDASSKYSSLFDVASKRMNDGIMVMIIRGAADAWWGGTGGGSFHALTLSGIDAAGKLLAFSDPNDTFRGANWGYSYTGTDALPTDSSYYGTLTLNDGLTVGNHRATYGGVEKAVDYYNGTIVSDIFLLTVPGPGAGVLALAGTIIASRRRRQTV